jgi:poly(3-hydroxybutyrate) depolymerase
MRGNLMKIKFFLSLILLQALSGCSSWSRAVDPAIYKHTAPSEYYLYVPEDYSTAKYWPVFVFIHGAGGSGIDCWNLFQQFAEKEEYILLCPSLSDAGGGWRQADANAKLISLIWQVQSAYTVIPQVFLAGFSAGGQFVQGFTFSYPEYVAGVSVIAPGNIYTPTLAAAGRPFYVMVGDQDDPTIIDGARELTGLLQQYGYPSEFFLIPGTGHTVNIKEIELTLSLYRTIFQR